MNKTLSVLLAFSLMAAAVTVAEQTRQTDSSVAAPVEYASFIEVTGAETLTGDFTSIGADENTVLVTGGSANIHQARLSRISGESTGGEPSIVYGVGACVLVSDGTADISDTVIDTDAAGGSGIFTYGPGSAAARSCTVNTFGTYSAGLRTSANASLIASDLSVTTEGPSSPAIAGDISGGTILINGGSYLTNGTASPAIYAKSDITVNNAALTANTSEALRLEAPGIVRLNDCLLSGSMPADDIGSDSWNVIVNGGLRNSTSVLEMDAGTLSCGNGNLFRVIGSNSILTLRNVYMLPSENSACFLRCETNSDCTFTAISQRVDGNIICSPESGLTMYFTESSSFTGTIKPVDSEDEQSSSVNCNLYIDSSSAWIVTDSCEITGLACAGIITDNTGSSVTIAGTDGNIYAEGSGAYTITVTEYSAICDTSSANPIDRY